MAIQRLPMALLYNSGANLYAVVRGIVNGGQRVWNPTLNAGAGGWEAFNPAHWTQYAINMTEEAVGPGGTGYYSEDYPTNISGVLTNESYYVRAGGSPAVGDSPAAPLAQSQGQNVAGIAADPDVPATLQQALTSEQRGAATGTPTESVITTDVAVTLEDAFQGRVIAFTDGPAYGCVGRIAQYDGAGKFTLLAPMAAAPDAGDKFVVV